MDRPAAEHSKLDAQMLARLLQRFKSMAALDEAPLHVQPVPGWTMDWDNPASDVAVRAELWELMSHYSTQTFPIRCGWYMDTVLEFLEPSEMARQIVVHRSYDPNEFDLLQRFLEPGMTFVDVGANFGAYTVFASSRVGPGGNVIAFEPSRRELISLHHNIGINRLSNVHVHALAVSDRSGTAKFSVASPRYSGHNKIGDLSLSSTMPTLRFTTDMRNHHWTGLNHGFTQVAIGKASALEVLIYSETGFEFALQRIELRPEAGLLGPWNVGPEYERPMTIPAELVDSFSHFQTRRYGQLDVEVIDDHLNLRGRGKAGAAFRCRLDPTCEYTFVIHGHGHPDRHVDQYPVQMATLDEFLLPRNLDSIDVLKIDIEGGEMQALKGARELLSRYKPLLMVEVSDRILLDGAATVGELRRFLTELGYVLFDVKQGAPRLIDLMGEHGANVIAAPERFLDRMLALGGLDRSSLTSGVATDPSAESSTVASAQAPAR